MSDNQNGRSYTVNLYSNIQTCPTLTPSEKCIRVDEFNQGRTIKRFHKHVPKHKLAKKRHYMLLRSLVLLFEQANVDQIVEVHLTRRGKAASVPLRYRIVAEYPEAGVLRENCGTDVFAWIDTVIEPASFRPSQ